ncbi:hypothetical protein MPH_10973 [Macrophomina phaseolina MS6]|uniref:Uncharacterized protein n=1 Tax=Macrophomina phaseolina (strain MS6) TaxID=1126212 RepID=K2RP17_MACPH|nr:hypothetical protein MPH_10973 [Macrophomina phaseolina MS6]
MSIAEVIQQFREQEEGTDIVQARWYIVTIAALAAASAGPQTPELYRLCTAGLPLDREKLVQRRLKEAVLKTSVLYGVPKSLQALYPLYHSLTDEQIDTYSPRVAALEAGADPKAREERGRRYFDVIWTPAAAQANREKNLKYHPDLGKKKDLPPRTQAGCRNRGPGRIG